LARVCEGKNLEIIIKNLISLQGCDCELQAIDIKRKEGPARIKTLEEELNQVEEQANGELDKAEAIKKERREIEQEIADVESGIEKSKEKLANIKSNKEYGAVLKEIEDLERKKAALEDRALQIMEETESLDEKYADIKERSENHRKKFEADQKVVQKAMKALDKAFKKHEKEKNRIRKEIDENLLKLYDTLSIHKGGLSVSSVLEGVCQTCHMGIPQQKFNELMRGDVLMNCPHCGRIMYWGDNELYKEEEEEK
jgi:predicted  nucleic acid-binding Zn-ribbon protein